MIYDHLNINMSGKLVFLLGRVLFAVGLIASGWLIYNQGHLTYDKYAHAFRKQFMPDTYGSAVAFGSFTWEQVNQFLIRADGLFFLASGFMILVN